MHGRLGSAHMDSNQLDATHSLCRALSQPCVLGAQMVTMYKAVGLVYAPAQIYPAVSCIHLVLIRTCGYMILGLWLC